MSKSKILLEKLTSLLAQGLISYKDLSNEVINIIKSQRDEIILKMNNVSGGDIYSVHCLYNNCGNDSKYLKFMSIKQ